MNGSSIHQEAALYALRQEHLERINLAAVLWLAYEEYGQKQSIERIARVMGVNNVCLSAYLHAIGWYYGRACNSSARAKRLTRRYLSELKEDIDAIEEGFFDADGAGEHQGTARIGQASQTSRGNRFAASEEGKEAMKRPNPVVERICGLLGSEPKTITAIGAATGYTYSVMIRALRTLKAQGRAQYAGNGWQRC